MKIKYSKYIPFPGFYAINLFGTFFIREEYKSIPPSETTINHETIHTLQAEDFCKGFFGYIIFYILYGLEWIFKLLPCLFTKHDAYYSISFEQEAYANQLDLEYKNKRKNFA